MFNPITQRRQHLFLYFICWSAIFVLHMAVLRWTMKVEWSSAAIEAFIYVFSFAFIGLGIWFVVRFTGLEASNLWNALITHIVGASLLITLWLLFAYGATAFILGNGTQLWNLPTPAIAWRATLGYAYYVLVALNYYLLIFYQNLQERQLKESEMKTLLKESELSMLKAQINPHFIFNSLNSISSLTLTQPKQAHQMIVKLSTFLRHTVGQSETELIPIEKEIDTIRLYLDIEQSRFGEKMNIEIIGLDHLPPGLTIPNLILQPLVENAIKYGVYENTGVSTISIDIAVQNNLLQVKITNSTEAAELARKGKGIGLKNVSERLMLIYERNDLLRTMRTNTQFEVLLSVPQNS